MGLLGSLADSLQQVDKNIERRKRIPMLTLDQCIANAYEEKKKYPQIVSFILKAQNLGASREDGINIIEAYLDGDGKAVTMDGTTALAFSCNANAIDNKIIDLLNGSDSAIYML